MEASPIPCSTGSIGEGTVRAMGIVRETVGFLIRVAFVAFLIGLAVGLYVGFRMGMMIDGPGQAALVAGLFGV
jgi:hypothetical protein